MITIKGKHNTALCFTEDIDEEAREQIRRLASDPAYAGCKIRIMPDVHAGKGCTIGTTMTILDKVAPSLVGVDIGCGMYTVRLGKADISLKEFDRAAHALPSGHGTWSEAKNAFDFTRLRCYRDIKKIGAAACSLGTLGGGNHFIELDVDDEGEKYLVVHSGSRFLGAQVAEHYMDVAAALAADRDGYILEREELTRTYKSEGREKELQSALRRLEGEFQTRKNAVNRERSVLFGQALEDYLADVDVTVEFARLNREIMANFLLSSVGVSALEAFHTIHNYIDVEKRILRKGAISAKKGERILIPINMHDGSLLCVGKGNEDWNCSAPHGAGRSMSRAEARHRITLEEYAKSMEGIYTTTVAMNTIDESPMAYKNMRDIMRNIRPTCSIEKRLTPIYNFKAGS